MALIVKGKMLTCCGSCDASGTGACKAWMNYRKHLSEGIPSDCPIISEIPDKHGRLIDADVFWKRLQKQTMVLWGEKSKAYQYFLDVMDMVKSAPTIVEATE